LGPSAGYRRPTVVHALVGASVRWYNQVMRIDTIQDADTFAALAEDYDELHARSSACGNPFLRHEWLSTWWFAYGAGHRLHVVTCRDEAGRLVGVLPGYIAREGVLPPIRTLRLLADECVGSTGLGPVLDCDATDEAVDALAAYLGATTSDWDVADLRFLDPSSAFFVHGVWVPEGGSAHVRADTGASPIVELAPDFERFMAENLSKHVRHNVRRARKRTDEHDARFEMITGGDGLAQALGDARRLFEGRMRTVVGTFFAVTPQFAGFTRRMTTTLAEQGRLRLGFLSIEGERVAFAYFFRFGQTMYAVQCGFAEEWGWLDVLKSLMGRMLEEAMAEGCTHLDYGLGDQAYKREWGRVEVATFSDMRIYGSTAASRTGRLRDGVMDGALAAVLATPATMRDPLLRTAKHAKAILRGTKPSERSKRED
jgi:CelD/BcsL family acetyltransferase involved in cellulose biosynthesis